MDVWLSSFCRARSECQISRGLISPKCKCGVKRDVPALPGKFRSEAYRANAPFRNLRNCLCAPSSPGCQAARMLEAQSIFGSSSKSSIGTEYGHFEGASNFSCAGNGRGGAGCFRHVFQKGVKTW